MKLIGSIERQPIYLHDDGHISFMAKMAIDCDGGPNPHHDPCWQPDTTLHHAGKPINSEVVRGIVVPPLIIQGVAPVVMGCQAKVTHTGNQKSASAVVFDIGPRRNIGEGSPALASALGINPNPNHGGEDEPIILYELWPGVPAEVDGVTYALQPA